MDVAEFQDIIRRTYLDRDRTRGVDGTFRWLVEEVGEMARSLRSADAGERDQEVGDVIAWVASVANLVGVELERALVRYANGCPKCAAAPCRCPMQ
jgi:NTP pyrophosphatase (non-canonical NTP hydrolase)